MIDSRYTPHPPVATGVRYGVRPDSQPIAAHDRLESIEHKLDLVLAAIRLLGTEPQFELVHAPKRVKKERVRNRGSEVEAAIRAALVNGTSKHLTDLHPLVEKLVTLPISFEAVTRTTRNMAKGGRLIKVSKGVYKLGETGGIL